MIGQSNILSWVDNNIDTFPHFIVLVGSSGSGKRTLAKTIAHKISCVYAECEIRVDAVREVIDSSYQSQTKVMYCFADADNMKAQAKNAMLKITEEPPENAYFCLTVIDSSSLLDTIKSRAYVINMEAYSTHEIRSYAVDKYNAAVRGTLPYFGDLCSTPGEVDMLHSHDPFAFVEYVNLVVDNIAAVEPANAFKSSSKLALKADSEGFDLGLFFKCFTNVCLERLDAVNQNIEDITKWCDGIIVTTKALNKVNKLGVNKQQLYDSWVFNIRKVWV